MKRQRKLLISDSFFKEFKTKRNLTTLRKINWGFVNRWRGAKAFWADPEKKAYARKRISERLSGRVHSLSKEGLKKMQDTIYKHVNSKGLTGGWKNGRVSNTKKSTGKKVVYKEEVKERINDFRGVVTYEQLRELEKLKTSSAID